jgi:hypothetical protein
MSGHRGSRSHRSLLIRTVALAAALGTAVVGLVASPASATPAPPTVSAAHAKGAPDLGPNVIVFDPSMPQSQIQATVDAVAQQQIPNQFGTERYALLFEPGTYGSPAAPLNFQVGYYTEVAGLGQNPGDVVINGAIDVFNQCTGTSCIALNNFWRSLSNLTINVTNPSSGPYSGCYIGEFWAVSQAAPMRRVTVNGNFTLMDYCTNPSFASGGFIADSRFNGPIVNGSQQQFYVRNSTLTSWSNGVWNQVFSGDVNAPAQCFPAQADGCDGPYTTLAATPASREKPYLYVDQAGAWRVFVPSAAANSAGPTWSATTQTPGRSIPLSDFYLASPHDSALALDRQLLLGKNLLLTPGTYNVDHALRVQRADTVVLGLGFATLTPTRGNAAISVANVPGVDLAGLIVDAGPVNSPVLVAVGDYPGALAPGGSRPDDPTALQDVFFRIGGPHAGRATVSLLVNSSHVILDDIWAWRADHGTGVGWTKNTAATGLVVNGDDVQTTGLFVEHYQRYEVLWNGSGGGVVFFQNEMPYDPPSQDAWRATPTTDGYPAFTVAPWVRSFAGYGMGSYSFFNQGIDIFADNAFVVPVRSGVSLHDLLTIFLDAVNGKGGIRNVVNGVGGSSTVANPDTPVTVVDYP